MSTILRTQEAYAYNPSDTHTLPPDTAIDSRPRLRACSGQHEDGGGAWFPLADSTTLMTKKIGLIKVSSGDALRPDDAQRAAGDAQRAAGDAPKPSALQVTPQQLQRRKQQRKRRRSARKRNRR